MALIQLAICMCEWKWGGNRSFSPFSPLCYSVTHSVVSPHMPEVTKCYTASQGKFIKSSVSVFIWLSRGTAKPEIFFDPKVVTRCWEAVQIQCWGKKKQTNKKTVVIKILVRTIRLTHWPTDWRWKTATPHSIMNWKSTIGEVWFIVKGDTTYWRRFGN